MEHVLRECMIALRLAERSGLEEAERSTVYYTALLVNVGCHADAHEQAKWFGDDIALKSGKYEHDLRSVRAAAARWAASGAATRRCIASVSGSSSRSPVAATSTGWSPGMRPSPRTGRAARPVGCGTGVGRCLVRAVGRQGLARWPGGRWDPGRCPALSVCGVRRGCTPAGWSGGGGRAGRNARRLAVRPGAGSGSAPTPKGSSAGSIRPDVGEVIDAEPALRVTLSDDEFDRALRAIADFVDLKSPYTLGHARAVAELAASDRGAARAARG